MKLVVVVVVVGGDVGGDFCHILDNKSHSLGERRESRGASLVREGGTSPQLQSLYFSSSMICDDDDEYRFDNNDDDDDNDDTLNFSSSSSSFSPGP